jgi:RNA polymerase sigma-70 factor (ECF subfamily)
VGPSEDARLVARLRRGDREALGETYARFSDRIFRFLVRLAGRAALAEDLHQETWVAAARYAPRLTSDTDLAAWLFTIARNKHRSWCRWSAAEARREEGLELDTAALGPDRAIDTRRDLERALAALPAIHREVLLLIGGEGLETAQAAAVLGLTTEAVRQRLARARAALGEALSAPPAQIVRFRKEVG